MLLYYFEEDREIDISPGIIDNANKYVTALLGVLQCELTRTRKNMFALYGTIKIVDDPCHFFGRALRLQE